MSSQTQTAASGCSQVIGSTVQSPREKRQQMKDNPPQACLHSEALRPSSTLKQRAATGSAQQGPTKIRTTDIDY